MSAVQASHGEDRPDGSDADGPEEFELVVRMSLMDAHYGGHVVAGARILELFGDAVTGVSARAHGNEGLLSSWSDVRFLKPVHPGDFLRIQARVTKRTRLRTFVHLAAARIIRGLGPDSAKVETVDPPECVAEASGIVVIPVTEARGRRAE